MIEELKRMVHATRREMFRCDACKQRVQVIVTARDSDRLCPDCLNQLAEEQRESQEH